MKVTILPLENGLRYTIREGDLEYTSAFLTNEEAEFIAKTILHHLAGDLERITND